MPDSQIYLALKTLTNAQIKTLPTTPVEIIPALGPNNAAIPIAWNFSLNNVAGAYGNVANAVWQLFVSGATGALTAVRPVAGILLTPGVYPRGVSGSESYVGAGTFEGSVITDTGNTAADTAIVLSDLWNVTDYTLGHDDNTLKISVFYVIADV